MCQEYSLLSWAKTIFKQVSPGTYGAVSGYHAWEVEGDHAEEVWRNPETETSLRLPQLINIE